jgi:hypothetical protein
MAFEDLVRQVKPPGEILSTIPEQYSSILTKMMENRRAEEKAPLEREHLKSQIAEQNALANWYKNRPLTGMGGGVALKNTMAVGQQIMRENPGMSLDQANQIAGAYMMGSQTLPDGSPLPPMSDYTRQLVTNVNTKNAPAAVQNQAANMNVLAQDVNDIDITPIQKFAGLPGRLDAAKYRAMMTAGEPVPQEYRDYLSFQGVASQFAMDALRKGFGTSVVPEYVYATLGQASNPGSTWWHDPKQVAANWKRTTDWINSNAKRYTNIAQHGIGAESVGGKSSVKGISSESGKKVKKWKVENGSLVEA